MLVNKISKNLAQTNLRNVAGFEAIEINKFHRYVHDRGGGVLGKYRTLGMLERSGPGAS